MQSFGNVTSGVLIRLGFKTAPQAVKLYLVAGDFSPFEPAVGGVIGDAQFPSVKALPHAPKLARVFWFVDICPQTE